MSSKAPSITVTQPNPPPAPTASQTAEEYAKALPIYYQAALQYEPQIARMEQSIQEQLYPQTSALQESMAGIATRGMSEQMPEIYRQQVSDQIKSQFGRNAVYNPIGQQQYGIGMADAERNWQNYYQNLGLTLSGRQPLTQPSNMMQSYTPAAGMGYATSNYGNYGQLYGGMYGANAGLAGQAMNYSPPWMNVLGTIGGGIAGGIGTGIGYGVGRKF